MSKQHPLILAGVCLAGLLTSCGDKQTVESPKPLPSATSTPSVPGPAPSATASVSEGGSTRPGITIQIFSNFVLPTAGETPTNPPCQPNFIISHAQQLVAVSNYHSPSSKGPVDISLRSSTGQSYGPWSATGSTVTAGSGSRTWTAKPTGVVLPAGTYTLQDSDNATWIASGSASGCGMSQIQGIPQ